MQYQLSCDMGGVLIMIIQTQNPLWQHLIGLNKACFLQDNTCLFHIIHPQLKAVPAAVQQFLFCELLNNFTRTNHNEIRSNLIQLRQHMGADQDTHAAFLLQTLQQITHIADSLRIEAVCRLIQNQQLGIPQQCHRNSQTPLHSH